MNAIITIQTDKKIREELEKRARVQGKTVSHVIHEILAQALSEQPLAIKTNHLKGQLHLPVEPADLWRQQIKDRNWRP